MAGPQVTLTIGGDASGIQKAFKEVGGGAKKMAADLDTAETKSRSFGGALDATAGAADKAERKFMGTADVLDGLGGILGVNTGMATGMMRAWADLSGGFATIQPMITAVATNLKTGVGGALTFISAHPVLMTIAALTAAFVLLWNHSDTFREIVTGAFNDILDAGKQVWEFLGGLGSALWKVAGTIKDALLWPYKTAFNAIARLWNNTVGRLEFEIPSWVPGLGGKGFSMPNLPTFHTGGIVPGPIGAEVPIMALAGEQIVPRGQTAPATVVSKVYIDGREIHQALLRQQRISGPLGLK